MVSSYGRLKFIKAGSSYGTSSAILFLLVAYVVIRMYSYIYIYIYYMYVYINQRAKTIIYIYIYVYIYIYIYMYTAALQEVGDRKLVENVPSSKQGE